MGRIYVDDPLVFRRFEDDFERATLAALNDLGAVAEGEVKEAIANEKDSRGLIGRVATGGSRQGVVARRARRTARGFEQVVEYKAPHDKVGILIEEGRKKGGNVSRVGKRKIMQWAKRKLGPVKPPDGKRFKRGGRKKAEEARAYLIARAISRRGIPALRPFRTVARRMRRGRAQRLFNEAFRRYRGLGQ